LALWVRGPNGDGMRQRCELCDALGADSRGHQLIGMAVGPRDALLCADHALFALDADVGSLGELRELFEFVASVEPSPDDVAVASRPYARPRRAGTRASRGAA
jgi:hypothetical protein